MIGLHALIYILVVFARIHRCFGVRGLKTIEVKSGSEPNHCAAIIDRCRARCGSPKSDGAMEYVQMTIKLLDSQTTCITAMTNPGELVPVNPNNTIRQIIMFNVPCCQQQRLNGSCSNSNGTSLRNLPTVPKLPVQDTPDILSTTPATTRPDPTVGSVGDNSQNCNQLQTFALIEVLLLAFVILCFLLLCLVLGILLKSRRRTEKTMITDSPQVQGNYDIQPENNAVLIDKHSGNKEELDYKFNDAGGGCSRNGSIANLGSETSYGKVEATAPPSDYVVLPNQSFPPAPKSARPSRSRQDGSSEEIIIVGAKNLITSPILGTESTQNPHQMPNNLLKNTNAISIGNGKVVERTQGTEKTERDTVMYINESNMMSPNTFGTTGRLPAKGKLNSGSSTKSYENQDSSRNQALPEVKISSWESSANEQDDSIYNRLRSKKNDDSYNDYQRLLRQSQINQNADVEVDAYDDVTLTHNANDGYVKIRQNPDVEDEAYDDIIPTNNSNGGYVKNFALASKTTMISNGKGIEDGGVKTIHVSEDL